MDSPIFGPSEPQSVGLCRELSMNIETVFCGPLYVQVLSNPSVHKLFYNLLIINKNNLEPLITLAYWNAIVSMLFSRINFFYPVSN